MLTSDVCSRFLITIKSYNLHVGDIRGVVSEIVSYRKKDYASSFLVHAGYVSFGLSLAFPFFSPL